MVIVLLVCAACGHCHQLPAKSSEPPPPYVPWGQNGFVGGGLYDY